MTKIAVRTQWTDGGAYERYVGRWSRMAASRFVAWLDAPAGLDWLDVGCGTGALTETIANERTPRRLVGIDTSTEFLDLAMRRLDDNGTEFRKADARDLPFADGEFDRIVSGLVLNFLPDPPRAVQEMARVLRAPGELALYVWDYAGTMEMMSHFWNAALAVDPNVGELNEARRFLDCRPEALRQMFLNAGSLCAIDTAGIEVPMVFGDFDDYWTPFLGGQGPAPTYCASLSENMRSELRDHLRNSLPIEPDGTISMTAKAWAVRGRKD